MRIGLIGDVHAEDRHLETALTQLTAAKVDAVLCVGDIVDGLGSVNRCVALLLEHGVRCVRGNHEDWLFRGVARNVRDATQLQDLDRASKEFLASLPETLEVATPEGTLLLCHGLGSNNMARIGAEEFSYTGVTSNHPELQRVLRAAGRYRFVVSGHSHRNYLRVFEGVTFVNTGTLKAGHAPGYAVLDTFENELKWNRLTAWID